MKRRLLVGVALLSVRLATANCLTLDDALAQVVHQNPQVAQARSALEQAAGQRLVVRSVALPDVSLGAIAGVQGGQRAGQDAVEPFAFAQGNLTQPLFQAAIPASLRRGDLDVLIAAQQLNVTLVAQLHLARIAFYTALYDRALAALGRSQRQRLDENMRSEQARYDAGTVDRGALASATMQAREIDPEIETAQRAYRGALLQLAAATGSDLAPDAPLAVPEGTLRFASLDWSLARATAAALDQRRGSPARAASR